MESPLNQENRSLQLAAKWNGELAGRVRRWKRLRFSLAIVLTFVGIGTAFSGWASIWSVPSFIMAFIAYLLYLDSRDQLREIRARKWHSITPRLRHMNPQDRGGTTQTAPSR